MKKSLLLLICAGLFLNLHAVKNVAYITYDKTSSMAANTTAIANDPIIQVLKADANLNVTVKALTSVLATDVISDLSTYDVIIIQESFSGSAGMLTPAGALALKTIPKPFIYNKTYALQKTRALTTSTSTGAGKEADGTAANGTLLINVESSALTNDLFKACTFTNTNQIKLFNALSNDAGLLGDAASVKAINYTYGLTAIPGSLLAQPAVLNGGLAVSVGINDVPAGTAIDGTETTLARGIFFGMNFGAISANNGLNITSDALTIWRNAVYILTGLTVPSTKATLPTGIINPTVENSRVVSENFYTINGVLVKEPVKGIYIKRTTFENGAVKNDKVVLTESLLK